MDGIVHGILQARILEWVAVPFSRGSSQPRDRTQVSCIVGGFFTSWATREAPVPSFCPQWMGRRMNQDLPDSKGLLGYVLCRRGVRGPYSPDHVHWGRRPSPSPGSAKFLAWCDPKKCLVVTLEIGSGNPRSQNALLNKANSVLVKQGWIPSEFISLSPALL